MPCSHKPAASWEQPQLYLWGPRGRGQGQEGEGIAGMSQPHVVSSHSLHPSPLLIFFPSSSPLLIVGTARHPKASLSFIPSSPAERQPQMWDIWGHKAGDAGTVWVPRGPGVSHSRCSPVSLGASPPPPPLPGQSGGIDKLIKPLPSGLAGETDHYWSFYF